MPYVAAGASTDEKPSEQLLLGQEGRCRLDERGQRHCWALRSGERLPGLAGTFRQISWRDYPAWALTTEDELRCWEWEFQGDLKLLPGQKGRRGSRSCIAKGSQMRAVVGTRGSIRCPADERQSCNGTRVR
jgi:hypothetical protein